MMRKDSRDRRNGPRTRQQVEPASDGTPIPPRKSPRNLDREESAGVDNVDDDQTATRAFNHGRPYSFRR